MTTTTPGKVFFTKCLWRPSWAVEGQNSEPRRRYAHHGGNPPLIFPCRLRERMGLALYNNIVGHESCSYPALLPRYAVPYTSSPRQRPREDVSQGAISQRNGGLSLSGQMALSQGSLWGGSGSSHSIRVLELSRRSSKDLFSSDGDEQEQDCHVAAKDRPLITWAVSSRTAAVQVQCSAAVLISGPSSSLSYSARSAGLVGRCLLPRGYRERRTACCLNAALV